MREIKTRLLLLLFDVCMAGLLVGIIYLFNYKLPQKGIHAVDATVQNGSGTNASSITVTEPEESNADLYIEGKTYTGAEPQESTAAASGDNETQSSGTDNYAGYRNYKVATNGMPVTMVKKSKEDWHEKFAQYFTDSVVATDTSYTSPDLSIQITKNSYDSGTLDYSDNGRHKKYGTRISYTLADIHIGDITCLKTMFAQDMYGNGYSEKLSDMSARMKSVLAVNGDSYNNNRHKNNGTIIRNGVIYRSRKTDMETCVLNWDGSMQIYTPDQLDTQTLIDNGAYQSWIFGPSLLDDNGKAKQDFMTWDYIRQSHPRTAIGYYEPGHYCLLVVDGREPDYSRGMFLEEEAAIFEQLGCKLAYNLDGGHCSFMTMQDQVISHPYKSEHEVPDGICFVDWIVSSDL